MRDVWDAAALSMRLPMALLKRDCFVRNCGARCIVVQIIRVLVESRSVSASRPVSLSASSHGCFSFQSRTECREGLEIVVAYGLLTSVAHRCHAAESFENFQLQTTEYNQNHFQADMQHAVRTHSCVHACMVRSLFCCTETCSQLLATRNAHTLQAAASTMRRPPTRPRPQRRPGAASCPAAVAAPAGAPHRALRTPFATAARDAAPATVGFKTAPVSSATGILHSTLLWAARSAELHMRCTSPQGDYQDRTGSGAAQEHSPTGRAPRSRVPAAGRRAAVGSHAPAGIESLRRWAAHAVSSSSMQRV